MSTGLPSHPGPAGDDSQDLSGVDSDVTHAAAETLVRYCHRCGARIPDGAAGCACVRPVEALAVGETDTDIRSMRSGLTLYFVLLLTFVVIYLGEEVQWQMATGVIDAVIVVGWCVAGWRYIVPMLKPPKHVKWLVASAPMALVTFTVATATLYPVGRWLDVEEIRYSDPFLDAGYGWATFILFICVQPAVIEELAFRGIILWSLTRILSVREAVVVSALMFMILHLSFYSFPHLFFMGLVLGWLCVKSGSLLPGMVLHFCHNLLCMIAEYMGY